MPRFRFSRTPPFRESPNLTPIPKTHPNLFAPSYLQHESFPNPCSNPPKQKNFSLRILENSSFHLPRFGLLSTRSPFPFHNLAKLDMLKTNLEDSCVHGFVWCCPWWF